MNFCNCSCQECHGCSGDYLEVDAATEILTLRTEVERWKALVGVGTKEDADRIAALEHAIRSLLEREDFWRNAGTLPGEYDNLVDVVGKKS